MIIKPIYSSFLVVSVLGIFSINALDGKVLYEDNFEGVNSSWKPFTIDKSKGTLKNKGGHFEITLNQGKVYGGYYKTSFSGHFEVEVDFEEEYGHGIGSYKSYRWGT